MRARYICAMAMVLALSAAEQARADLVVQKDGSVLEGTVVARDAKGLSLQVDGRAGPVQVAAGAVVRVIQIDERGAVMAEGAGMSLPAKRAAPQWNLPPEPLAPPVAPAAGGPTYYLIPLHGPVGETYLADTLEKSLADAARRKPTVVVLDINSPGGLVSEAELMVKTLHRYNKELRIVALADQDLSASAITSLSVRTIYMKSTGTLGAATAFGTTGLGTPVDIQEKFQSAWRAVARNSAEEGDHDPLLAEAMIDNTMELHVETVDGKQVVREGAGPNMLTKPGKILTLTSHEAVNCGLSAGIADDLNELGQKLNLKGWKECPGLGTLLADYVARRRDFYEQKTKEIEADFKASLAAAQSAAPAEGPLSRRLVIGPRGIDGSDDPASRLMIQELRTTTPEQRAQWNSHSLAAVVALQKMEQDLQDEISLAGAFGKTDEAEDAKGPLAALADVRARLYAERTKYAGESPAPPVPAPPVAATPPVGIVPPRFPATPVNPAPRPSRSQTQPITASTAPPLVLKNAALPPKFSVLLKQAMDRKAYRAVQTNTNSQVTGADEDLAAGGGVLIGLRCGLRNWVQGDVVTSLQPVYLTAQGVLMGPIRGDPNATPVVDLVARDGYAVGGARVEGVGRINGLALRFVRMGDGRMNPADFYESDTVGKFDKPVTLGNAMPVVGMTSRVLNPISLAFGLLTLTPPEPRPASVMPPARGPVVPLAAAFADAVTNASTRKTYQAGVPAGSMLARTDFEEIAPNGGILVGLRCGKGKNGTTETVASIQPIFLTPGGEVMGQVHGDAAAVPVVTIKAPPGFAVGAVTIGGSTALDSLTVTFMKLGDRVLLAEEAYVADKIGTGVTLTRGPSVPSRTFMIGGDGTPVIGINGKLGDQGKLALGLVFMTPTEMSRGIRQ